MGNVKNVTTKAHGYTKVNTKCSLCKEKSDPLYNGKCWTCDLKSLPSLGSQLDEQIKEKRYQKCTQCENGYVRGEVCNRCKRKLE